MRPSLTSTVDALAQRLPPGVIERLVRRDVVGVNYHVVSDEHLPHVAHVLRYKSVASFADDIDRLQRSHDLVDHSAVDEVCTGGRRRRRAGRAPLHLTFDDGYAECFTVVRPMLARRGIPCTFFVITDAVDNRFLVHPNKVSLCIDALVGRDDPAEAAELVASIRDRFGVDLDTVESAVGWLRTMPFADTLTIDGVASILGLDWHRFLRERRPFMTADQIRRLARDGFTIGAHSRTHPYLRDLADADAVEAEVVGSCLAVRELTGQERVPFAFPFSADGLERDLLADIRRRHDFIGLLFDTRELRRDRPFVVNRIPGDGGTEPWAGVPIDDVVGSAYRRHVVGQVGGAAGSVRRALRSAAPR